MKKPFVLHSTNSHRVSQQRPRSQRLRLGAALLASCAIPAALAQSGGDAARLEKLEQENQALRARLDSLENLAQKEGIAPSGAPEAKTIKAFSEMTLSGFVTASYFYDFNKPKDRKSDGYLWNSSHNSFSLNKVKVTLASPPAERSGDTWSVGYRASLIWGEDAPIVNTGGNNQGLEALREAYIDINAPLGTGLNLKAGQLISLLNYESGDGGAVNANFSQGYQWWYTGNGPSAGVQAGYTFTDWLDLKLRLQNGLFAGPVDNNGAKTFIGAIGLKPTKDLWFSLIGFTGEETDTMNVSGGSVLAGWQVTPAFTTGFEFDYFVFNPDGPVSADEWSLGAWLGYDFCKQVGVAFRADYIKDPDGFGIPGLKIGGRADTAILSTDTEGDLGSLTFTVNYKPTPSIKIQPEFRYDYTGYKGGLDGHEDRFIIGAGISYLF